jgi:hypothetical protein
LKSKSLLLEKNTTGKDLEESKMIEIKDFQGLEIAFVQKTMNDASEAMDVVGNASYLGVSAVLVKTDQLSSNFFDLKTGLAGEILQKFSNYRLRLVVVGGLDLTKSSSLRDFVYECNKVGNVIFTSTEAEAVELLKRK